MKTQNCMLELVSNSDSDIISHYQSKWKQLLSSLARKLHNPCTFSNAKWVSIYLPFVLPDLWLNMRVNIVIRKTHSPSPCSLLNIYLETFLIIYITKRNEIIRVISSIYVVYNVYHLLIDSIKYCVNNSNDWRYDCRMWGAPAYILTNGFLHMYTCQSSIRHSAAIPTLHRAI